MTRLVRFRVAVDAEGAEAVCELFNSLQAELEGSNSAGTGNAVIEASIFPDETDEHPELADLDHAGEIHVSTVMPEGPAATRFKHRVTEGLYWLSRLHPVGEPEVSVLEEKDWQEAWKRHYARFRVGRRIVIEPAWEEATPALDNQVALRLNPGMAFGTGLHPSTQLCLRLMEELLQPGDSLLDVGTGSGILALAGLKLGARQAVGTDKDAEAVDTAAENARYNLDPSDLSERLRLIRTETPPYGQYDFIVVNILPDVIRRLLLEEDLLSRARPGAWLVLSGIVRERAGIVRDALLRAACTDIEERLQEDWVAFAGRAPE